MPRPGALAVKREPSSDHEDRDETSQFGHSYLTTQSSDGLEELSPLAPAAPTAIPVCVKQEPAEAPPAATFETLEPVPYGNAKGSTLMDRHLSMVNQTPDSSDFSPLLNVKDEPLSEGEQQQLSGEDTSDSCGAPGDSRRGSPKSWTQQDMDDALEALRKHNMSLTKASARYGIPSTTLWQRAHRLGIDTPKKEGGARAWGAAELRAALHALRAGAISANKASKAYGIPSSTLYKIARREGIRLAAPFNAAPTSWRRADLDRALDAIRCGAASVQRAAHQFGIPTGTLYGRCKREGIELSRSSPAPWSEAAMVDALEAVRVGQMSINQAAIHYNLPYSSLYGRFKRCRPLATDTPQVFQQTTPESHEMDDNQVPDMVPYCQPPLTVHSSGHATLHDTNSTYRHEHLDENVVFADQYSQYYQGCSGVVSS